MHFAEWKSSYFDSTSTVYFPGIKIDNESVSVRAILWYI